MPVLARALCAQWLHRRNHAGADAKRCARGDRRQRRGGAVWGENMGGGVGVKGSTSVTGTPVLGVVTNAANGSPAVSGSINGTGAALRGAQTGTGYGVSVQITNTSNGHPCVLATTNGLSPAVRGVQAGPSRSALSGHVSGASNATAAVVGAGSASGRGGATLRRRSPTPPGPWRFASHLRPDG